MATYQEVQLDRDEYMNLVAMESEAGMAVAGKCHSKAEGKSRAWSVNHLNNETIGQHTCKRCRRERSQKHTLPRGFLRRMKNYPMTPGPPYHRDTREAIAGTGIIIGANWEECNFGFAEEP